VVGIIHNGGVGQVLALGVYLRKSELCKKCGINASSKVVDHNLWIVRTANNFCIVELQTEHPVIEQEQQN
jgi:hypothetical protein